MAKNDAGKHGNKAPAASSAASFEDEDIDLDAARAAFEAEGGEVVAGSGFPPYLKPVVGKVYHFTPIATDARTPKFIRHTCIWNGKGTLIAATGPVDAAEPVEVKPGELFTISDYKGLPFADLMGLQVMAFCSERRSLPPLKDGTVRAPMYVFELKLRPEDAKTFHARKSASGLAQAEAARQASLAAHNAHVDALPLTRTAQQSLPAGN